MQGTVCLPVPAAIQPMALCLATVGRYGAGAAQHGKTRFTAKTVGIFSSRDNKLTRRVNADAFESNQSRAQFLDKRLD